MSGVVAALLATPPEEVIEIARAGGVDRFVGTFARALALGSIYALMALSFVLVFKATQAVNFAQGGIALVGTWWFSMVLIDWRIPARLLPSPLDGNRYIVWFTGFIVAIALAVGLGLLIERLMIRPMIGKPLFSLAIITLGLEGILRTIGSDAVTLYNRTLAIPWAPRAGERGGFDIGRAFISWTYLAAVIAAAAAFILTFLYFRTRRGIAMRAVAFDQEAALAQGIKVGRVFAIAWAAGAAFAVLGAIFFSSIPFGDGTATVAATGLAFRALPAVILGGLDSVHGALIGGLVIGGAEVFAGSYLSQHTSTLGAGFQQIVPYLIMLAVLFVRPYGLFGTPEIRRV